MHAHAHAHASMHAHMHMHTHMHTCTHTHTHATHTHTHCTGARSPRSVPLLSFYDPGAESGTLVRNNIFYQSEREREKRMPSLGLLSDSVMPQSEIFNTYCADTANSSLPCNCIQSLSLTNQTAISPNLYPTLPSSDSTFIWPDLHLT
jgi:hypothetical protein